MVFDDLKYIRKKYGENMSHLCRELFPTILEKPGLLYNLLTSSFCESKELYYDIVKEHKEIAFKNYILSFYAVRVAPSAAERERENGDRRRDKARRQNNRSVRESFKRFCPFHFSPLGPGCAG